MVVPIIEQCLSDCEREGYSVVDNWFITNWCAGFEHHQFVVRFFTLRSDEVSSFNLVAPVHYLW